MYKDSKVSNPCPHLLFLFIWLFLQVVVICIKFYFCNQMPEKINLEEERLVLIYDFQGVMASIVCWSHCCGLRTVKHHVRRAWRSKVVSLMANRKGRGKEQEQKGLRTRRRPKAMFSGSTSLKSLTSCFYHFPKVPSNCDSISEGFCW